MSTNHRRSRTSRPFGPGRKAAGIGGAVLGTALVAGVFLAACTPANTGSSSATGGSSSSTTAAPAGANTGSSSSTTASAPGSSGTSGAGQSGSSTPTGETGTGTQTGRSGQSGQSGLSGETGGTGPANSGTATPDTIPSKITKQRFTINDGGKVLTLDEFTGPCAEYEVHYSDTPTDQLFSATFYVLAKTIYDADANTTATNAGNLPVPVQKQAPFVGTIQAGVLWSAGYVVTGVKCVPSGTPTVDDVTGGDAGGGNATADSTYDLLFGCNAFKVDYDIDNQGVTGKTSISVPAGSIYWFNTTHPLTMASEIPAGVHIGIPTGQAGAVLRTNRMTLSSVACAS